MLSFYMAIIDSQEDRELFESLYAEYKNYMIAIAYKVLGDYHAAENIVHDAFIRMIDNLDNFDLKNGHKTKHLIGNIVDGFAKNEYKRRKRLDSLDDSPEERATDTVSVEEQIIEQAQYDDLMASIKKLDPIYADVLFYRFVHHYSIKEISIILEVSEDTVRQRAHRAKKLLWELLAREGRTV